MNPIKIFIKFDAFRRHLNNGICKEKEDKESEESESPSAQEDENETVSLEEEEDTDEDNAIAQGSTSDPWPQLLSQTHDE